MKKIGFIALAHPDYISDGRAKEFAERAVGVAEKNGYRAVFSGRLACDTETALRDALEILRSDVCGTVLFLASWLECPVAMTAVKELCGMPLFLWGFPMWEEDGREMSTGSYVSYAMFRGVLSRIGRNFRESLGMPGDRETDAAFLSFCRAAYAKKRLSRSKIGLVGYSSMSIYTGTFDHVLMRYTIGPEIVQSDSYSLIRCAESTGKNERDAALERLRADAFIPDTVLPEMLDKAMGLYLAIEKLRCGQGLDALNCKCQYEFSKEYGMTLCVPLSMAAAEDFVTSCEGDILCTVSMLILNYLTGQVIAYGDAINHKGNVLKLSPCGFMPYKLAAGRREVRNFMEGVGFTGIQNSFTMKPGRVTLLRLVEDIGGYHFLCTAGEGLADTRLRQGCMPALDVIPDCDTSELARHYAGQHFALCYGDVTEDISGLAGMLGIGCTVLSGSRKEERS